MTEINKGERRKEGFFEKIIFPRNIKFPAAIASAAIVLTALLIFITVEQDTKTPKSSLKQEKKIPPTQYRSLDMGEQLRASKSDQNWKNLLETQERTIELTVRVISIRNSIEDIIKTVTDQRGKIIKTEILSDRGLITAKIAFKNLNELIEKLNDIGLIDYKKSVVEHMQDEADIAIKVLKIER